MGSVSSRAVAQAPGSWDGGFNHDLVGPSATVVNDYLLPFRGTGFVAPPTPPAVGATAAQNFYWGQGRPGTPVLHQAFNAIHMALIPKGPHQGRILVWGAWYPVRLTPATSLGVPEQFCQAWSIIDPVDPTQRFRNFLLPLRPVTTRTIPPNPAEVEIADLFCTGHAWSQEGDLIVAGGATGWMEPHVVNGPSTPSGAKFFLLFDPSQQSQRFGSLNNLYGSELGHWQFQSPILVDRFYPTTTLSQRLSRNQLTEVVMVAGGSDDDSNSTVPEQTYETYVPGPLNPVAASSITQDPDPNTPTPVLLDGPTAAGANDLLEEYPRLHLLRDGKVFKSGPLPLGAKVNQDVAATPSPIAGRFVRPWDTSAGVGRNVGVWNFERHDGASLVASFNDVAAAFDIVIRLGGGVGEAGLGQPSTDTAEYWLTGGSGNWGSLGVMPGGPRQFPNAVILPDGSILVIGGADNQTATYTMPTVVYRPGIGWQTVTGQDTPTRRAYHSCAVLLPDARVFVGGGELLTPQASTEHDYDIYVPHYLKGNPVRPVITELLDLLGAPVPFDGATSAYLINAGDQFIVSCGDVGPLESLSRIVLMAPGSITHHSDMTARLVQLPSSALTPNKMQVQLPTHGGLPRGFYMCFAVSNAGTPSVATWIKVL